MQRRRDGPGPEGPEGVAGPALPAQIRRGRPRGTARQRPVRAAATPGSRVKTWKLRCRSRPGGAETPREPARLMGTTLHMDPPDGLYEWTPSTDPKD